MRISELKYKQWQDFAFRLIKHSTLNHFEALRIANGESGNLELKEAFLKAGMTPRRAAIHAGKVERYGKT